MRFLACTCRRRRGARWRATRLTAVFANETAGGNAIHSWYSRRSDDFSGNSVSGYRDGIYLEFTEDSEVVGNTSADNLRYGLHFMFSDRCSYERNVFERNRAGVAVMYADGITLRDNVFRRAWGSSAYGLLLKEIKDGVVEGNRFEGNSIGLLLESADRLAFTDNTFRNNGWAIKDDGVGDRQCVQRQSVCRQYVRRRDEQPDVVLDVLRQLLGSV